MTHELKNKPLKKSHIRESSKKSINWSFEIYILKQAQKNKQAKGEASHRADPCEQPDNLFLFR